MKLLGSHMSVEGGVHRSLERGKESGCDAIQLFTRSGRQWKARPIEDEEASRFRAARKAGAPWPAVAHASYLINMGSPDAALRGRSLAALVDELERCDRLGLPFLIIHPGAHMGRGEDQGITRIASTLDQALGRRPRGKVRILLENTAGMGTSLGHTFGQIAAIRRRMRRKARTGACIDTCHLFAAGYDISTEAGYHRVMEEMERELGLETVRAFHLNDSKGGLGCRLDRHEHIGRGRLGVTAFWCLMNDPRFDGLPMILETPKGPDMEEDRVNLALLRRQMGSPRPVTGPRVAAGSGRRSAAGSGAGGARRAGRAGGAGAGAGRRPALRGSARAAAKGGAGRASTGAKKGVRGRAGRRSR